MLYLLLAPLQFLHLTHLLGSIHWDRYGTAACLLMIAYLVTILTLWELVRLSATHFLIRGGTIDDPSVQQVREAIALALMKGAYIVQTQLEKCRLYVANLVDQDYDGRRAD